MNKLKNLGRILSKTEQKKIMGGIDEEPGPYCPVNRPCFSSAFPLEGICYPSGLLCLCKRGGVGGYSLDCTDIA